MSNHKASHRPARTFYVSPSGRDANPGTRARPWKTTNRVIMNRYGPGDRILFKGGAVFDGFLWFDARDAGTPGQPLVISTWGKGRAVIRVPRGMNGIEVHNAGGMEISNLDVRGTGPLVHGHSYGIFFWTDLPRGARLRHVRVDNVSASGFGQGGMNVIGSRELAGYDDFAVTRSDFHHNLIVGLNFFAGKRPWGGCAHRDVYVGGCRAWSNKGVDFSKIKSHSGNGILLAMVDGAVVEHCQAWDNGNPGGAGVGIWSWCSNHVVIQFCEAFRNRTANVSDGGGFDLDGGITNSVMRFNYSHDNDGAGYGIYQFNQAPSYRRIAVCHNLSENDGRKNSYGGACIWCAKKTEWPEDIRLYNNTFFTSPSGKTRPSCVAIRDSRHLKLSIRGNIFVSSGGARMISAKEAPKNAEFDGNIYCALPGKFAYKWGGRIFNSIEKWREATGREALGGEVDAGVFKPSLCGSRRRSPAEIGGKRVSVPARGAAGRICEAVLSAKWPARGVGAPLGYKVF